MIFFAFPTAEPADACCNWYAYDRHDKAYPLVADYIPTTA